MSPIQLFNVVSQHNRWLSARQATIAGNVANVNTIGYKAVDVEPFEMAMAEARVAVKATKAHMVPAAADGPATRVQDSDTWDITHSGNSVSMEQELIKAGEVNRAFRLNTSVAKAFHRMMLASAKV